MFRRLVASVLGVLATVVTFSVIPVQTASAMSYVEVTYSPVSTAEYCRAHVSPHTWVAPFEMTGLACHVTEPGQPFRRVHVNPVAVCSYLDRANARPVLAARRAHPTDALTCRYDTTPTVPPPTTVDVIHSPVSVGGYCNQQVASDSWIGVYRNGRFLCLRNSGNIDFNPYTACAWLDRPASRPVVAAIGHSSEALVCRYQA
ncbi:hypothetical protein [Sinosporangium siamense]|uniref:Uncharacterized protein n=1 Tax=Sinosporangium siamense TaxID=1367973 RepID=A0A919RN03_9ACTN|nr:hypothetical protein [Sinosporangium siamense]GII96772.1 hypothetical protein Ssi02_70030 [Sinosporangium siamense]